MPEPTPGTEPRPKPRDPFGPPLDHNQVREVFRRLATRPQADQEAFVSKLNWNLLDERAEHRLVGWLLDNLCSGEPARQAYVLKLLNKLPHFKRARHAPRFQAVMASLSPDLAEEVADAFGPVLGGAPKKSTKGPAAAVKAPGVPAPKPVVQTGGRSPEPPREASGDDLSKLKDFFGKFGGAK
jgi:hypothetical protein